MFVWSEPEVWVLAMSDVAELAVVGLALYFHVSTTSGWGRCTYILDRVLKLQELRCSRPSWRKVLQPFNLLYVSELSFGYASITHFPPYTYKVE